MVDLCHDRFAGQSTPIHIGTHREIDFRRDDCLIPFRKIVQRTAQNFFAPAISIHVGCVKKVNAKLKRSFNERPALFLIQTPLSLLESVTHAAQTDSRYFKPGFAKVCIVHLPSYSYLRTHLRNTPPHASSRAARLRTVRTPNAASTIGPRNSIVPTVAS